MGRRACCLGETAYSGDALIKEHRYARDLAVGVINDGLKLQ